MYAFDLLPVGFWFKEPWICSQKRQESKAAIQPGSPSKDSRDAGNSSGKISTLDKEVLETIRGGSNDGRKTISVGRKKISVTNLGNFSPPPSAYYYNH